MTKLEIKTTPEQDAIIHQMAKGQGSMMIEAGAGCAKTTTLKLSAPGLRAFGMALAFNKRIAQELQQALPATFSVKTLNGLGHGAWSTVIDGSITIDDRKVGKLVSQMAKANRMDLDENQWTQVRDLVRAAQQSGLVPTGHGPEGWVPDAPDTWTDLAEDLGVFRDDQSGLCALARDVLVESIRLARAGTITFDDQIYCPVMLGGRFPQFSNVMVDEYQDLNALNIGMLGKVLRAGGRLFVAGDRHQAIYGFRGAAGDAAERIRELSPQWTTLPLLTTFRCPQAIVARQQGHIPGFRCGPGAPPGLVVPLQTPVGALEWDGWRWDQVQNLAKGRQIAVLCRNNAPLLSLAFKLIRKQIGVHMLGREIGKGLVGLSRKLAPDDQLGPSAIAEAIAKWQDRDTSLLIANGKPEKCAGIIDRAECLMAVLESAGVNSAGQMRRVLETLFSRTEGQVTLSSIHRAKGLEWPTVVHLDPWRVPSRWARDAAEAGDPRPLQQERNLQYVCETRTKDVLVLASLKEFK